MVDRQFDRNAEVIAGPKFASSNTLKNPDDALVFFKNRIKFQIEKDDGENTNKGKAMIYNLSQESRGFLEKNNLAIILKVGYGDNLSVLFFGDVAGADKDNKNINGVSTKRVGPDLITTIEMGDSEEIVRKANIQIGFSSRVTNIQILEQAIAKLKLSTGPRLGFKTITYDHGFSFSGKVSTLLTQLSKQSKVNWAINDGEISFLPLDTTEPGKIIKLNSQTGLIGTPTKTKTGFKFSALINTGIRPGKQVFIESNILIGTKGATVKILKAKYIGDTHEGKWVVHCEGIIL